MSRLSQQTLKDIGRYADFTPRYFVIAYTLDRVKNSAVVIVPFQTTAASMVREGHFFLTVAYPTLTLSYDEMDDPRVAARQAAQAEDMNALFRAMGVRVQDNRPARASWNTELVFERNNPQKLNLLIKILLTYMIDLERFFLLNDITPTVRNDIMTRYFAPGGYHNVTTGSGAASAPKDMFSSYEAFIRSHMNAPGALRMTPVELLFFRTLQMLGLRRKTVQQRKQQIAVQKTFRKRKN